MADGDLISDAAAAAFAAVVQQRAGQDILLAVNFDAMSAPELTALIEAREAARRADEAVDQRLIAQVGERNIAGDYGATTTVGLLVDLLRISPREARRGWRGHGTWGHAAPWVANRCRRSCR